MFRLLCIVHGDTYLLIITKVDIFIVHKSSETINNRKDGDCWVHCGKVWLVVVVVVVIVIYVSDNIENVHGTPYILYRLLEYA